jgi:hypothetical protein
LHFVEAMVMLNPPSFSPPIDDDDDDLDFFLVMVAVMMDNWDQVPSSVANDMKNLSKVIDSGLFNSIYSLQWGFCMHLVEMVQVCKHLWFAVVDGLKLLESYGEFFKLMAMGQHTRFIHWLTDLFFSILLETSNLECFKQD